MGTISRHNSGLVPTRTSPLTTDELVDRFAQALTRNPRLHTLCEAALHRTSQSNVLQHFTAALDLLGRTLQKHAQSPLEKATAWMLRGYKTSIAVHMFDILRSGKDSPVLAPSELDPDVIARHVIQEQRMKQFMKEKFPYLEQHPHGSFQISEVSDDEYRISAVGQDDDLGYAPDLTPLSEFTKVEPVFAAGPAFAMLYRRLKSTLFPSACERIENVVRRNVVPDDPSTSVAVTVEWQLLEYLENESISADELDSIFTLTGEFDLARVYRLSEYMSGMWGKRIEVLDLLRTVLRSFVAKGSKTSKSSTGPIHASGKEIEIECFPATNICKEQAYVKIQGSLEHINQCLQQFAWLTATLRSHFEGRLTVSDIDFRAQQVLIANSMDSFYHPVALHMSLSSQGKLLKPSPQEPGQCWTSACPESILAHGFQLPESDRPKAALGVEIPFDIMAAFAGVRYPVFVKNRIIFAGNASVLVAESKASDNAIQWHLEKHDGSVEDIVAARGARWDPRLETLNMSVLTASRAFLGYCRSSEILLGTVEAKYNEIQDSDVPRVSKADFQSPPRPVSIDVDYRGVGHTSDGVTWKFSKGETALVHSSRFSFDERLRHMMSRSTLLYDQNAMIAYLVPTLSVLLHMVSSHVFKNSQLRRSDIPTASVSADGADAAYKAIRKAKDLTVPFPDKSEPYSNIVQSFLDVIEQREVQTEIRRHSNVVLSKGGLRGWDHADAQTRKYEVWERELCLEDPHVQPLWWKIFEDSVTLVLFTRLSKSPIRNSDNDDGPFNCRAWDEPPKGRHLLLANTTQLDCLRNELCSDPRRYPDRYMLSDKIAWARPANTRLFDHTCKPGTSCSPIQAVIEVGHAKGQLQSPTAQSQERQYLQSPGHIATDGAVLFADDPSSFEPRRCIARRRPKVSARGERNYLFFCAALAAFGLVYWNFYFFLFSVVLFGLAYALSG